MQLSGRRLASGLGAAVMTVNVVRWGSGGEMCGDA